MSTEHSASATSASGRLTTHDITLIAMFTALMAICSWISIPSAVPFTMQTFGVFLTVSLLGGKRGTIAVAVYLLLGAAGLPVFSGFTGGPAHMMGPTGGYIAGFLLSALTMWLSERIFGKSMPSLIISMLIGLIICYAFGTAWFMTVYTRSTGQIRLTAALTLCVIPYIIPDIIKIILAASLTRRLRKYLMR